MVSCIALNYEHAPMFTGMIGLIVLLKTGIF